jgi:hypothetical protein
MGRGDAGISNGWISLRQVDPILRIELTRNFDENISQRYTHLLRGWLINIFNVLSGRGLRAKVSANDR